jgi:hypothetical protein
LAEGGKEYTVNGNEQLLLDSSILPSQLASDNVVQPEDLEEASILDTIYDDAAGEEIANAEDIENLEETAAAGTTEVDALAGRFEDRTGDEIDITTDLRDATFPAGTDTVIDEGEDITPAVEELQDAVLTLSATPQLTEDGGIIIYTVTSDITPSVDMTVTLSNGLTVTIGAGSRSGTASFTVTESDFEDVYVDSDSIPVSITDSTSGGFASVDYTTNGSASTAIVDTIDNTTLTLGDVVVSEGGETAVIEASLDNPPETPVTVTLSNGATITFAAGSVTGTSTPFSIQNDDVLKDAESYTVSVSGTSGGNFENLITTDTAQVTVHDTIDTVTATLSTTTEQITEEGGIVTYIVTLSGGPGAVDPNNDMVFTLDNGEEVTVYAGDTIGSTTRTYTDEQILNQPNIVNSISSYTGGAEYEKLVTTGITNIDINYEPSIEGAAASQSDALLFTQAFARGSLSIDYDIDGAAAANPFGISYDGGLGGLISQTSVNGITTLISAAWVLTINEANGDYTFTQTSPYSHDSAADSDSGTVRVTITDSDGQQASADLVLTITDDVPSIEATNAIGLVGDGTYSGTMDVSGGADIPAVTSVILNTVTVAGTQVQDFNFNYDQAAGVGNGNFVYEGKTYNFNFTLDPNSNNYTVTLESVISVDGSETLVASQEPGGPTADYGLSYTVDGEVYQGTASANTSGNLALYTFDGEKYTLSGDTLTLDGDKFNVSDQGFGVGGNNNFESNKHNLSAESFTFNMDKPLYSITLEFGANGLSGNDVVYLDLTGTGGETQKILLSATNGDFLYDEATDTYTEIAGGFDGGSTDTYTIELPEGWQGIDSLTMTAGMESTSLETSVKVNIDFMLGTTTTEEVIMDYTAQVTDSDGDMDSVGFVVVSDADEDSIEGVITGTAGDDYISGTAADDIIDGAGGDDIIDAGDGNDTLIVSSGDTLDFSSLGSGKVSNIENLDFRGGSETTVTNLTVQSVFNMTDDNNVLHLMGDDTDSVQIDDSQWTLSGTTEVNGITYNQYLGSFNDGSVDQTVILNVQDTIDEVII